MKKYLLILCSLYICEIASAQLKIEASDVYKFEIGFETSATKITATDAITFEDTHIFYADTEPFIGFFPFPKTNISFGIRAEYTMIRSDLISLPDLYGIGCYSRFIYPKKISYTTVIFNKTFTPSIEFFAEININKINYTIDERTPEYHVGFFLFSYPDTVATMKYTNIDIPVGIIFNIWKGLNIELGATYSIYIKGNQFVKPRISISYIIKSNQE